MKTLVYSMPAIDVSTLTIQMLNSVHDQLRELNSHFCKSSFVPPSTTNQYRLLRDVDLLGNPSAGVRHLHQAMDNAAIEVAAKYLMGNGLASISRVADEDWTWDILEGDMFCPQTNNDIDPKELARQKKSYRARVRSSGVWTHQLNINGEDADNIGGFVGKDFHGSGYDNDFYYEIVRTLSDTSYRDQAVGEFAGLVSITADKVAKSLLFEIQGTNAGLRNVRTRVQELVVLIDGIASKGSDTK